ncbi:MAG: hypothetical protein IPK00_11900 [Deltaproteobacteria bacterium]|nr:hypothetical protein [Deltaproteobacteria bacterium]
MKSARWIVSCQWWGYTLAPFGHGGRPDSAGAVDWSEWVAFVKSRIRVIGFA